LEEASYAYHRPEDVWEEFEAAFKATLFSIVIDVRVHAFHVDLAFISVEFPALDFWNTGVWQGF
jgi:hypothetical protein